MRKIIAACVLLMAMWVGSEIYSNGVDGAFDGRLADAMAKTRAVFETPADHAKSDRSLAAFQRAFDKSEDRVDEMFEQPGGGE
jgi:hypothetical protein